MTEPIKLVLNSKPTILRYAKQGMPGRTGPMGEPGEDATQWAVTVTMEGVSEGTCRIHLYKDGLPCEDICYAAVYTMPENTNIYGLSGTYSRNIQGSASFEYTNVKAIFVEICDSGAMNEVYTSATATMIRGRDLKLLNCAPLTFTAAQWAAKGTAGVTNIWTTGSGYDNSDLQNGDLTVIIGSVSDQLDGTGEPISAMIIGQAYIPDGETAMDAVTVLSRALFVGQQGARGPKGDPGATGESVPWGGVTGDIDDQEDLTAALDGKVNKSGDTMTGMLALLDKDYVRKVTSITDGTAPVSDVYISPYAIWDANNGLVGYLGFYQTTANRTGWRIIIRRQINGTWIGINAFQMDVDTSGTIRYALGNAPAFRNALGGSDGLLSVAIGGTGASDAAGARANLGAAAASHTHDDRYFTETEVTNKLAEKEDTTTFTTFSGTSLVAADNTEYSNSSAIASLTLRYPAAARGMMFGVNFTSGSSFSGVTFKNSSGTTISPKLVGDPLTKTSKRYNLICWYDGSNYWAVAKAA